ncbi:MAG: hypothetical protein MMC33_009595 [Icmadophila ericetorum]|nr:hypothetical protein [Icmadophila ericetorum]
MPTPFAESILTHILASPASHELRRSSISSNTNQPEQAGRTSGDIELQQVRPKSRSFSETSTSKENGDLSRRQHKQHLSVEDVLERQPSALSTDSEYDSSDSQMKRRSAADASSSSPASSSRSGSQNGHANGAANGKMNKNLETRRKNVSLDTPTLQTTHLVGRADFSLDNEPPPPTPASSDTSFWQLPRRDRRNFLLLVLLYFLQGIPMGLASGSVPILLKKHLSYGQIGVFTLASYPYSLKLLWSPIVDAVWSPRFGRRKSWILPIQLFSGFGMLYMGGKAESMMESAGAADGSGIWTFTWWWFFLVFLCATQDIAVDGWALTLLSTPNLSYASTAQTVGLTAGQFLSYTVFLAFNTPDFANHYFRAVPSDKGLMTLGGYLTFWGWAYLIVTIGLAILKKEEKTKERDGIVEVYKSMFAVLKLKNIQSLIIIHLIAKIGFQANDAITNLKLLDKGLSQEQYSLTVLIDFPFEIALGYYAGRWSTAYPAIHVWCWAFIGRLIAASVAQFVVMIFPTSTGITNWYLLTVIASHIFSTFTSTVMFVAISAFHAKIADPVIGGTYMTLLATVSNLGGTFPRYFILQLVDIFTVATCSTAFTLHDPLPDSKTRLSLPTQTSCALEAEKHRCELAGGKCVISRDGYYITNVVCVLLGVIMFWGYIQPTARRLAALPLRAWRVATPVER